VLSSHTMLAILLGSIVLLVGIIAYNWSSIRRREGIWACVNSVLGWFLIGLGILGGLLPIIPGLVFGILGLLLLGVDDPVIRWVWLRLRRLALAWSRRSPQGPRRQLGLRMLSFESLLRARLFRSKPEPEWLRAADSLNASVPPPRPDPALEVTARQSSELDPPSSTSRAEPLDPSTRGD